MEDYIKSEDDDYIKFYYGDNRDGEELVDRIKEITEDDISSNQDDTKEIIEVIAMCDDCDYTWDDAIGAKDYNDYDYESSDFFCPMCGSSRVKIE